MRLLISKVCLIGALAVLNTPSHAQHAHGKGLLQLSLNGDVLEGQWQMPMEALLGFETLPRNAAQTDAMNQLQRSLQNASYFIDIPVGAKCQQVEVKADSDMFRGVKSKGHSDLQYAFKFKCAQPLALTQFGFPFFKAHIRSHQLKVEWVTATGQKSTLVRSGKPIFVP